MADRTTDERRHTLTQEREDIQKRTFTKWTNSFLRKVDMEVLDLFKDLSDGVKLLALLEVLSGTELEKPSRGKLRLHKMENVGKALGFLKANKVKLENISADNIVDGHARLTLGLIWTIILRFQIQEIRLEGDAKSAKDALLYWCQKVTRPYDNVKIDNFTSSWKDGLAFAAIIHAFRPDLIDYASLVPAKAVANMTLAFSVADEQLGIAALLDPEDVLLCADEKSVITYLVSYYHFFSKLKADEVDMKRLNKLVNFLLEIELQQSEYEHMAHTLLEWIRANIQQLQARNFPNNLPGLLKLLGDFKQYRTVTKPPRFVDRGNLEAHLFAIQTQLFAHKQPVYHPPEGLLISDISALWVVLEQCEHSREIDLRQAVLRQEALQQLAARFDHKAALREVWLADNLKIIEHDDFGSDLAAARAAQKRHEAIETDAAAHEDRIKGVSLLEEQLLQAGYHAADDIADRAEAIMTQWNALRDRLRARRLRLDETLRVQAVIQHIKESLQAMADLSASMAAAAPGNHLGECEDSLQRHTLREHDIAQLLDRVCELSAQAQVFVDQRHQLAPVLQDHQRQLAAAHTALASEAKGCRRAIESRMRLFGFLRDAGEIETWIKTRTAAAALSDLGKDVASCTSLLRKQVQLTSEIASRERSDVAPILTVGARLCEEEAGHAAAVETQIKALSTGFAALKAQAAVRKQTLENAVRVFQFTSHCNIAESWLLEREVQAGSEDYGHDVASTENMFKRHTLLEGELQAYAPTVQQLKSDSVELATLTFASAPARKRLKALYSYQGRRKTELSFAKGDIFVLIEQSTSEWLSVESSVGLTGYIPANYVKELKDKDAKSDDPATSTATNATAPASATGLSVAQPMDALWALWERVQAQARQRRQGLDQALALFRVMQEQDELESWLQDHLAVARAGLERSLASSAASTVGGADLAAHADAVAALRLKLQALAASQPHSAGVMARQAAVEEQWAELQRLAKEQAVQRAAQALVQGYFLDADEARAWIAEKDAIASSEDYGKDVVTVQSLQRKHEAFVRDLAAVDDKVHSLDARAAQLAAAQPTQQARVLQRQQDLSVAWTTLQGKAQHRTGQLNEALFMQQFRADLHDMQSWMQDVDTRLQALVPDSNTSATAVATLRAQHADVHAELDAWHPSLDDLARRGREGPASYSSELSTCAAEATDRYAGLSAEVTSLGTRLDQHSQYLGLAAQLEHYGRALDSHQRFLDVSNLGSSLPEAQALLKRHTDLQRAFQAETDSIAQLQSTIAAFGNDALAQRLAQYQHDRAAFAVHLDAHARALQDSAALFEFLQQHQEAVTLLADHVAMAATGAEPDLSNLQVKRKAHLTQVTELAVAQGRVEAARSMGGVLVDHHHPAAADIATKMDQLSTGWAELVAAVNQRQRLLDAALQEQEFHRLADDCRAWSSTASAALASADVGRDLASVQSLQKRHAGLEGEFAAQQERLHALRTTADQLTAASYVRAPSVVAELATIEALVAGLVPALAQRRTQLARAEELHQFVCDCHDDLTWFGEKHILASATELGKDLPTVQYLVHAHSLLATDVRTRADAVPRFRARAEQLQASGLAMPALAQESLGQLETRAGEVRALVHARGSRLDQALAYRQLLHDCQLAEEWLADKRARLLSEEVGHDEASAQHHLHSHSLLTTELAAQRDICESLARTARDAAVFSVGASSAGSGPSISAGMASGSGFGVGADVSSNFPVATSDSPHFNAAKTSASTAAHPDAPGMAAAVEHLREQQTAFASAAAARESRLQLAMRGFQCLRELDEARVWVEDQMVVVMASDLGANSEEAALLLKKYEDFLSTLATSKAQQVLQPLVTAQALLALAPPQADAIAVRHTEVDELWSSVELLAGERRTALLDACNLFRFREAASDLDKAIADKNSAMVNVANIPDLQAIASLTRQHDDYERNLAPLEQAVDTLQAQATTLVAQHPEASTVTTQMAAVSSKWLSLVQACEATRLSLTEAHRLLNFKAYVRECLQRTDNTLQAVNLDLPATSVEAVLGSQQRLADIRPEIDARESECATALRMGQTVVAANPHSSEPVQRHQDMLSAALATLQQAFVDRGVVVRSQLEVLQCLREMANALAIGTRLETTLSAPVPLLSLDGVHAAQSQLATLRPSIQALRETVDQQHKTSDALSVKHPAHAIALQAHHSSLTAKSSAVAALADARHAQLAAAVEYHQYMYDVEEFDRWMGQCLGACRDESHRDPTNLHGKQARHLIFEQELLAHRPQLDALRGRAEEMTGKKHFASIEVQQKNTYLAGLWDSLLAACSVKGKNIGAAIRATDWTIETTDAVQSVTRLQNALASEVPGTDADATRQALQRVERLAAEQSALVAKVTTLSSRAAAMVDEGHYDRMRIRSKQKDLATATTDLQAAFDERRRVLTATLEMQQWLADASEAQTGLADTERQLRGEPTDCADRTSTLAVQHRLDAICRDLQQLEDRVTALGKESRRLTRTHRELADEVRSQQARLEGMVESTRTLRTQRRVQVAEALETHEQVGKATDLTAWMRDISREIANGPTATSVGEAAGLLVRHQETRAEMDAREPDIGVLTHSAKRITSPPNIVLVRAALSDLTAARVVLAEAWEARRLQLEQDHDLQLFLRSAEQAEGWLGTQERAFDPTALGDSLSSVAALAKQHTARGTALQAHNAKIDALEEFARRLAADSQRNHDTIHARLTAIVARRDALQQQYDQHVNQLEQARRLHAFLGDACDLQRWIGEKVPVVTGRALADTSAPLARRVQRFDALRAEITASTGRYNEIVLGGESLCTNGHYASDTVQAKLAQLRDEWQGLQDCCEATATMLREATLEQAFVDRVEDVLAWIAETTGRIAASEEHSRGLVAATVAMRKHQRLEADIAGAAPRVEVVETQARDAATAGNSRAPALAQRAEDLQNRFDGLVRLGAARRDRLKDAVEAQQFLRDVDNERAWVAARGPTTAAADLGTDMAGVQALIKKLQQFQTEVEACRGRVQTLSDRGHALAGPTHPDREEIEVACVRLEDEYEALCVASADRKHRLDASLSVQEYYTHAAEASTWMAERVPGAASSDYGSHEAHAIVLSQAHATFLSDVEAFQKMLAGLRAEAQGLIAAAHYDETNIAARQGQLEEEYAALVRAAEHRTLRLRESVQLLQFERDRGDLDQWMLAREATLASTDTGRDRDEADVLLKRHLEFVNQLAANQSRIATLDATAVQRISEGHTDAAVFADARTGVMQRWAAIVERATARERDLVAAQGYHSIVQALEESVLWIGARQPVLDAAIEATAESIDDQSRRFRRLDLEVAGYQDHIGSLDAVVERFITQQPQLADQASSPLQALHVRWDELRTRVEQRRARLAQAQDFSVLCVDISQMQAWIDEQTGFLQTQEAPATLKAGELLTTQHRALALELANRTHTVSRLSTVGDELVASNHYASADIQSRVEELHHRFDHLQDLFATRQHELDMALDIHRFVQDADQAAQWVAHRHTALDDSDIGGSLEEAQALLKKHQDLERALASRETLVLALRKPTKLEGELEAKRLAEEERLARERAEEEARVAAEQARIAAEQARIAAEVEARMAAARARIEEEKRRMAQDAAERQRQSAAVIEQARLQAQAQAQAAAATATATANVVATTAVAASSATTSAAPAPSAIDTGSAELVARSTASPQQPPPEALAQRPDDTMVAPAAAVSTANGAVRAMANGASRHGEVIVGDGPGTSHGPTTNGLPTTNGSSEGKDSAGDTDDTDDQFGFGTSPVRAQPVTSGPLAPPEPRGRSTSMLVRSSAPATAGAAISTATAGQASHTVAASASSGTAGAGAGAGTAGTGNGEMRARVASLSLGSSGPLAGQQWDRAGLLNRKPEKDAGGKRNIIRNWKGFYAVLRGASLNFYSSEKDAQQTPDAPAVSAQLVDSACTIPADYTKREAVLHLTTADGAECMLQAVDHDDAHAWIAAIQAAAARASATVLQVAAAITTGPEPDKQAKAKTSFFGFGKRK